MGASPDDRTSSEWPIEEFVRAHRRPIVGFLCAYGAIRILVFAAAFPLFNITDEDAHFVTMRRYAEGHLPSKTLPLADPGTQRLLLYYGSPEYTTSQGYLDRYGPSVPFYQLSPQAQEAALKQPFYAEKLKNFAEKPDFEAQSPPLYYMVAAAWYKLGAFLGIRDWALPYWVRSLNAAVYALLIWLSYRFIRKVYPDRAFLAIAVPALIAVYPQDVFFGMNRDVLSAPLSAAALLLMIHAIDDKPARASPLLLGSLLAGLGFLVQISNCVLFGALAITFCFWARHSPATKLRKIWIVSASSLAALAAPIAWMVRNYLVLGDLTGARAKMRELTWTTKPLADIFHHPVFSWHGLSYFLLQLTRTFWHGEYLWHGQWMRSTQVDWFYVFSSALVLFIFATDFTLRHRSLSRAQHLAGFQALFLVVGSVLFLAVLSLLFDFHDCVAPSRRHPFFSSGRLISGILLPFALMYAAGLELIVNRLRRWVPPLVLLLYLMTFITVSEIMVRREVFSSAYNFFALFRWPH